MPPERNNVSIGRLAITFLILMVFWYILSGYMDPFYIGAGIICCAIVTLISGDLIFRSDRTLGASARSFIYFICYIPQLMLAILYANLDVAYRILHPGMPIDPGLIRIDTSFQNDILRTAFANAMTLTPGTVTVDVHGGTFIVHALLLEASEEELLHDRSIQQNLARIFGEQ